MIELIGLCLGIVFSIAIVKAYTVGLQHGKELSKGNAPKLDINPVKAIVKAVEQVKDDKQVKVMSSELNDVFAYSRESALDAIRNGG